MSAPIELTPERKLEYLREKLTIAAAEARTVTGWPVVVEFGIFHHLQPAAEFATVCAAAALLGWQRKEWSSEEKGGAYSVGDSRTNICIYDAEMHHEPKPIKTDEQHISIDEAQEQL